VNVNSNLVLLIQSKYSILYVGIVNIARIHTNCEDLIDRPRIIMVRIGESRPNIVFELSTPE